MKHVWGSAGRQRGCAHTGSPPTHPSTILLRLLLYSSPHLGAVRRAAVMISAAACRRAVRVDLQTEARDHITCREGGGERGRALTLIYAEVEEHRTHKGLMHAPPPLPLHTSCPLHTCWGYASASRTRMGYTICCMPSPPLHPPHFLVPFTPAGGMPLPDARGSTARSAARLAARGRPSR